ncbi:S-adenosyl-L-methionine-dependent methyltransferase [Pelagophyceae sp. CCMP2097]|nr:S-adenosyl-L-methionine-dependent methyltransferase [Pelagophyceae sp. CCMP2097]
MLKAHPRLRAVAFDFAPRAIEALRAHADFDSRRCNAVVCDVAHEPLPVLDCSADYVTCFFALSAVAPRDFPTVAQKLAQALKPGGRLLFRDYGRYDLAQLRFKKGRRLGENHYVRSEGTLSYFFTPDQLVSLFQTGAGLEVVDCGFNKRNQLNRATEEERKRVFVQAHFSKPIR